jgi:hypothetical protein
MAYLLRARERRDEVLLALDEQLRAQEAWADREAEAAAKVQTRFRSSSSRRKYRTNQDKAAMLQRIYRGYEGRVRASKRAEEIADVRQRLLFDYFAEVVQRTMRGYLSRKKKHDFHARRKYIDDMVSKSEELQQQLNRFATEAREKEARKAKEERDRKLKETSTQLHYLVSTRAQRGVMNTPAGHRPTIDGVPAEDVVNNNVREYLRAHKLDVRKALPLEWVDPIPKKATIRASGPYSAVQEQEKQEKKWSRLRRVAAKDFVAGTRPKEPQYSRGIADGCEYIEPRTLNISTKEILGKQKDKFVSKKPFFMAVKTGKGFDSDD